MKTKDEVIDGYMSRHTPEGQVIRSELEGIWNNGYQSGLRYNEKKLEIETTRQYNKGYSNGLKEAQDIDYQHGYDKGADDARYELWWAIKKIVLDSSDGGLSCNAVKDIFGTLYMQNFVRENTPEEVIEKIKAYEKSAPTKREKLKEVFGYDPADLPIWPLSWWDEPYEEPEDNDNA